MTCPTLVLAGDSDWWLGPGLLRGIAEVVKRPEVHVLKGASHWIQQDKCGVVHRDRPLPIACTSALSWEYRQHVQSSYEASV